MVDTTKGLLKQTAVAILCGGRGTRMGSADRHKVCFPIDGIPAINRTVKMFYDLGLSKIVLVVGALAETVIETVGDVFPRVVYAYEREQLGTGHAAQIAVASLEHLGHQGPILITMGDKIIQPGVIRELGEAFVRSRADLVFVTGSKTRNGQTRTAGRILTDRRGRILGNLELRDIQRGRILSALAKLAERNPKGRIGYDRLLKIGERYIPDETKLVRALGPVATTLAKGRPLPAGKILELLGPDNGRIRLAAKTFTPEQAEQRAKTVGLSVYLGGAAFWARFLPHLQNTNAQHEYYLTDVINLAVEATDRKWRLAQHVISRPGEVMAFNSPDELLVVEDTLRRKGARRRTERRTARQARLPRGAHRPAGKWLDLFEQWPASIRRWFAEIYGPDTELIADRRKVFLRGIKLFIRRFGAQRRAILVRAPGRINLLGRHIDHRGGAVNVMAIDRDVVFVASAREDDVVTLCNTDPSRFPDRRFSVGELLGDIDWEDWLSYINSEHVRAILSRTQGDWSNYVKASLLRLQQRFRNVRILGFDAAVAGDIPMAAGLSSSSALVVASAEAAVSLNGLGVEPSELVDLCGEGEWFAGSRGGAGDHTAIRMGRRGQIAQVKFFPFQLGRIYGFPERCTVIIAHSGIDAKKSAAAKDKFNEKTASYELAFMLLKDRLSQYTHLLEHVRDLNPQRLNCKVSDIYRMLLAVPEFMSVQRLNESLSPQHREQLERIFASHRAPNRYDLRGVLLYGIAECQRSLLAPQLLEEGKMAAFGRLMLTSHDGDRVASTTKRSDGHWHQSKFAYDCSDAALASLVDDLTSEDPARVLSAQLYMQAGAYGCSTPQIDKMVDLVKSIDGVYGAQLGGAGLGGCIMILARPDTVSKVRAVLKRNYYNQTGSKPLMHVCHPVAGSGLLRA